MQNLTRHILGTALLSVAVAAQSAPPLRTLTITDLGALGSSGTYVNAINNRGDIVGRSGKAVSGVTTEVSRAFVWQNDLLLDLGSPVGQFSEAMGINDRGTIAVKADGNRAYLFKDGTWVNLNIFGTPYAINRFDGVTGMGQSGTGPHAFLWQDGILRDLGTLGGSASAGLAINDKGDVAGISTLKGDTTMRAFVYMDGAMKDLGAFGTGDCFASDINDHRTVVGYCEMEGDIAVPFIWENGTLRPLFSQAASHWPTAINNQGAIVGGSGWGGFLFEDGVLRRLESLPSVRAAGWTLLYPIDINDQGWIAGYGYRAGMSGPRAFLLKPAPASGGVRP